MNWSRIVMVTPATLYQRLPSLRQRQRRTAVVAAFAGFPLLNLGYAALVATGILPSAIWGPIAVALFVITLLGIVAIYGWGQGRITERREDLDERQRAMVDRALVTGYGALTTVIVLILGALALYLSFIGPITLDMTSLTPWVIAVALYVPFLPFAALAWIEPDAPADDDVSPR
jgi:O-antigen/teichoic acid export membrane protein